MTIGGQTGKTARRREDGEMRKEWQTESCKGETDRRKEDGEREREREKKRRKRGYIDVSDSEYEKDSLE